MAKAKRKAKKYNPVARRMSRMANKKHEIFFMGGNCFDGVVAGGPVTTRADINFILSQRNQWTAVIMVFGFDEETGDQVMRTEEIPFKERIDKEELKQSLDPMLEDFVRRIDHYGGVNVISTGYFISPSIDADMSASLEVVYSRFERAGAFNEEFCRLSDEVRYSAKQEMSEPEVEYEVVC